MSSTSATAAAVSARDARGAASRCKAHSRSSAAGGRAGGRRSYSKCTTTRTNRWARVCVARAQVAHVRRRHGKHGRYLPLLLFIELPCRSRRAGESDWRQSARHRAVGGSETSSRRASCTDCRASDVGSQRTEFSSCVARRASRARQERSRGCWSATRWEVFACSNAPTLRERWPQQLDYLRYQFTFKCVKWRSLCPWTMLYTCNIANVLSRKLVCNCVWL